jgi:hypothetical protein
MSTAVGAVPGSLLLSFMYDPTGLEWCTVFDNPVFAWVIDETGAVPPEPVIIGTPPPVAPDTDPVLSPPWAVRQGGPSGTFYIPDVARGDAHAMLNFIARNNGANRQVYANFADISLVQAWQQWTVNNPLALSSQPQ